MRVATSALRNKLSRARKVVHVLVAMVKSALVGNKDLLAGWNLVKRVPQAPKASASATATPVTPFVIATPPRRPTRPRPDHSRSTWRNRTMSTKRNTKGPPERPNVWVVIRRTGFAVRVEDRRRPVAARLTQRSAVGIARSIAKEFGSELLV